MMITSAQLDKVAFTLSRYGITWEWADLTDEYQNELRAQARKALEAAGLEIEQPIDPKLEAAAERAYVAFYGGAPAWKWNELLLDGRKQQWYAVAKAAREE